MKHIYKYATAAHTQGRECIDVLSESDVKVLRNTLIQLQLTGWIEWRRVHNREINKYFYATPSARKKNKRWQTDLSKFALGAYYEYERAEAMLNTGTDEVFFVGGSARGVVQDAWALYWTLIEFEPELWPFGGESPFDN